MKREVLAGLLVAAALGAGILFARSRRAPVESGNPTIALDLSEANGRTWLDGVAVDVAVEPRPARPFEELTLRIGFEPDEVTRARVSFNMTMDMGPHDYTLVRDGAHWLARGVVLPKCGSGSGLWFADLEFHDAAGKVRRGRFRLELVPES